VSEGDAQLFEERKINKNPRRKEKVFYPQGRVEENSNKEKRLLTPGTFLFLLRKGGRKTEIETGGARWKPTVERGHLPLSLEKGGGSTFSLKGERFGWEKEKKKSAPTNYRGRKKKSKKSFRDGGEGW